MLGGSLCVIVGASVGNRVGWNDGLFVSPTKVGEEVIGTRVGPVVGILDGSADGARVG
jgi:hypothetical protein